MTNFWMAKGPDASYAIGVGNMEYITVCGPTNEIAEQWARVCIEALRENERRLVMLAQEHEAE